MARARYFEVVMDTGGRPLPSATVNVYQPGTTTPITETIFAADTGATTLTNPLTANAQGEIEFYLAAPKRVDLRWVKTGYTTESHPADVMNAEHAHSGAYAPLDATLFQVFGENPTDILTRSRLNSSSQTMITGQAFFTYFTPLKNLTITKIAAMAHALSSSPTLVRFGLYTVAADDALTLVAATANDATIFAGNNALYERALSTGGGLPASYDIVAGTRYAGCLLIVGGTPGAAAGFVTNSAWSAAGRRIAAYVGSQSDLPASATAGSLSPDGRSYVMRFAA